MDVLIARQPVFDAREKLVGYALTHSAQGAAVAHGPAEGQSAGRLMVEALLGVGLDTLVDEQRLFLPVDAELLQSDAIALLPAARTTLLISAAEIAGAASAVSACERLLWAGYKVALVDVDEHLATHPIARLADAVVVDVRAHDPASLAALVAALRPLYIRLLASHVRHRAERDHCLRLGFELFFGHRSSRPERVVRKDVPIEHLQAFRLLRLARDPATTDAELETMLKRDVTLSYKLLRMVNSAELGLREVWSIGHALRLLGRVTLTRWLSLLLLTDIVPDDDRGTELSRVATMRARLCELLAKESGVPRAGESLYLVGLLSLVDEMLELPPEQVVQLLQLAPDVRDALLHRADFYGEVLAMVEAYEVGDWATVETLGPRVGIAPHRLGELYVEALQWVNTQRR